ncbi:MAG: class I SAM-dependent methyltransferase [Candidatus Norongarragalinales archaeon]
MGVDIVDFWRKGYEKRGGGEHDDAKEAEHVSRLLTLSGRETLLDVGCGAGSLLAKLPAKSKTGLDFSKPSLDKAKANNPRARFVLGEAADLPFASNSFDRVLSYSTFIYYPRDYALKALAELERVCKKGGRILVGDVADASAYPGGRIVYGLRTRLLNLAGKPHYTCYSRRFFEMRGFEIETNPFNKKRFNAVKDIDK